MSDHCEACRWLRKEQESADVLCYECLYRAKQQAEADLTDIVSKLADAQSELAEAKAELIRAADALAEVEKEKP